MKPAFSTVACPDWTFTRLAEHAARWGYVGCELRTFGYGTREFACDPALTAPAKLRGMLERIGLSICSLATSVRYDDPITPPLLGLLLDNEQSVRETKNCIDIAVQVEAPFVRVFGFEIIGGESRASACGRIADRMLKCLDYCRNSGVRLAIENGGSFSTAVQLAELMDKVNHPLLSAAYSAPVARAAGEDPANGANVLGERLELVKIKDLRGGVPCALGDGDLDCQSTIAGLSRAGFKGWVVYEYDRAWLNAKASDADTDAAMTTSAQRLFQWIGGTRRAASVAAAH